MGFGIWDGVRFGTWVRLGFGIWGGMGWDGMGFDGMGYGRQVYSYNLICRIIIGPHFIDQKRNAIGKLVQLNKFYKIFNC